RCRHWDCRLATPLASFQRDDAVLGRLHLHPTIWRDVRRPADQADRKGWHEPAERLCLAHNTHAPAVDPRRLARKQSNTSAYGACEPRLRKRDKTGRISVHSLITALPGRGHEVWRRREQSAGNHLRILDSQGGGNDPWGNRRRYA